MYFPGVGSYQTAPGLLQPLCGKSNTDCSQIYDLSRRDAFVWLAVNRSVLYPIWIVSGYKQLKSKWCPCPRGATDMSVLPFPNNCWSFIHSHHFLCHRLLNGTLTLCGDGVNRRIYLIRTAVEKVLEPMGGIKSERWEAKTCTAENKVAGCQLIRSLRNSSSSIVSSIPREVEHRASRLDIVLIHCQYGRTPTGLAAVGGTAPLSGLSHPVLRTSANLWSYPPLREAGPLEDCQGDEHGMQGKCEEDEEVKDGTGVAAVKLCESGSVSSISWSHSTGAKRSTCRSTMCYWVAVYWCQF